MLISMYGFLTGHKILANNISDDVVCSINMSGYNISGGNGVKLHFIFKLQPRYSSCYAGLVSYRDLPNDKYTSDVVQHTCAIFQDSGNQTKTKLHLQ